MKYHGRRRRKAILIFQPSSLHFFVKLKKVEQQLSNGGGLTWIVGCLMLATVSFTIYLNWHIQCFKTKCIFSSEQSKFEFWLNPLKIGLNNFGRKKIRTFLRYCSNSFSFQFCRESFTLWICMHGQFQLSGWLVHYRKIQWSCHIVTSVKRKMMMLPFFPFAAILKVNRRLHVKLPGSNSSRQKKANVTWFSLRSQNCSTEIKAP